MNQPPKSVNIDNLSLGELKIIAFDHIQTIARLQQELQILQQRIMQMSQIPVVANEEKSEA